MHDVHAQWRIHSLGVHFTLYSALWPVDRVSMNGGSTHVTRSYCHGIVMLHSSVVHSALTCTTGIV